MAESNYTPSQSEAKPLHITVVIPAYNEEKYIGQTLERLQAQTYKNFDILVVDNNSTDQTTDITRKYGAQVLHERKQGYVYCLNSGLMAAKGDIISVTDADTQPTPHWLESIAEAFGDETVVCVTGPGHIRTKSKFIDTVSNASYDLFLQFHMLINKPHMSGGFNMSFRKWALHKLGGLNPLFTMSPDIDMGLRMMTLGKVKYVKRAEVVTSTRRWKHGVFSTFYDYTKGYFYSVWLRKPPPVKQNVIR